jgi:5-nitroimidazole antibiotic resistance protein nimB
MRRKDREVNEISEILKIADSAEVLHLGLFDGEYPYVVPLHYGYVYEDEKLIFYMHGAKEGHKLDLIRENAKSCIELECDVEPISGGDIACKYSSSYSSIIAKGVCEIVEDSTEKLRGLNILMKHQTGKKFEINEQMAKAVTVMKFTAKEFSAKARGR